MAAPTSPLNAQSNQLDFLTDQSTNPAPAYYERGLNPVTMPGVTGAKMADKAIATHVDGETVTGANANVVAIAGMYSGATGPIVHHLAVDSNGNIQATAVPPTSSTATTTGVTATGASTQLLAANASRRGFAIVNNATGSNLYLLLAHTGVAGPTNLTVILGAGQYYEPPAGFVWVGQVLGAWSANTGVARITEFS